MNRISAASAMTMKTSRGTTPLRASPLRASSEAKLAIAEVLLTCEDMAECAEQAMEWLGENVGVRQASCLTVDRSQKCLVGLAGWGVPGNGVRSFSVELEDHEHPFIAALARSRATTMGGSFFDCRSQPSDPRAEGTFAVIPLEGMEGSREEIAVGLLLVSPAAAKNHPDLIWLADRLRQVLRRRLGVRYFSEVERGLRRERSLLYNVLNTVHAPIILTDTEGRLIISNRSAEFLFGGSEEESEARRCAVALKNMFLSAAISRHAIGDPASLNRELPLVDPVEGSDLYFEF